ncbi:MAG: enoyl-CoA hydratase/isomerase family protein [Deltaproteobacteria bacterium]|nr:enoyl-CoA hydratase/isomerase family protein [Deltaproteobacteria bacterium]
MESEEELLHEANDHVATLMLNRPQVHNAISMTMRRLLGEALDRIEEDDDIRVVILTGAGPSFCSGVDLKERRGMPEKEVRRLREKGPVNQMKIINLSKPVIAAVCGNALAGGCELALACDIRVASEDARFGLPETNLGIIPAGGGTQLLPRLVGDAQAREIIFTGRPIDAARAERIGLVNYVLPREKVMEKARELAGYMKDLSPTALKKAKEAVNRSREVGLVEGFAFEAQAYLTCIPTKDRIEALRAYSEKRRPIFTGE